VNSTELYSNILANLSNLRNFMVTQDWIDAVSAADPATQKKAFNASFAVGHAINTLSNQVLSDIADEMAAQDTAITAATTSLKNSVDNFAKVNTVLTSLTKLLAVVGQIVSLA
jgi:hypothetical protein